MSSLHIPSRHSRAVARPRPRPGPGWLGRRRALAVDLENVAAFGQYFIAAAYEVPISWSHSPHPSPQSLNAGAVLLVSVPVPVPVLIGPTFSQSCLFDCDCNYEMECASRPPSATYYCSHSLLEMN